MVVELSAHKTICEEEKNMNRKNLLLNDNDFKLFSSLYDFVYLDPKIIRDYIFDYKHPESASNRLRKLEDFGYIKSHKTTLESGARLIYTLDTLGLNYVYEIRGEKHWRPKWTNRLQPWFMHTIYIAHVFFLMKNEAKKYDINIDYINEKKAYFQYGGSVDKAIRPDGFIVVSAHNVSTVVFLEMEHSLTRKNVIVRKLTQYEEFMSDEESKGRFYHEKGLIEDVQEYLVLFVTLNEQREKFIKKIFNSILPNENETLSSAKPGIHVPVKLANIDDIQRDPLGDIYNDVRSSDTHKNSLF